MTIARVYDVAQRGFEFDPGNGALGGGDVSLTFISEVPVGNNFWIAEYEVSGTPLADQSFFLYNDTGSLDTSVVETIEYYLQGDISFSLAELDLTLSDLAQSGSEAFFRGNDQITGNSFDDRVYGFSGNDLIDGGGGFDTAAYFGDQINYTLTLKPFSTTITDRRFNGDGTDELINIEQLDFRTEIFGVPFDLTQFGGTTGLSEQNFESFIELYIAYFNRAPDAIGLNFWGTAYANGTSLEEMATLFVGQEETLAAYPPGTSNEVFAETVYNNVLGRTPDQAGFDFWVGQLDSEAVSRDQFILEVLGGVQAGSPDRSYLDDKVDIGAYFAVHKGMSDVDDASDAMALFDGSDASIDAAVNAIDAYYTDALDPTNGEFLMQVVGVLDDPFAVG
ncbi:MAG: DUF4214 domain-containing protein [Roseobacter sp.]